MDLFPELEEERMQVFKALHNFSVFCGNFKGTILGFKTDNCRTLLFDRNTHVVVTYHERCGTSRRIATTARCTWTLEGETKFETECVQMEFLLSSEDTAVDLSLLRQFANPLVVGTVRFSPYVKSYNRKFGYRTK